MTRADEDEILRGVYTECNECAQDDRVRLLSPLMVIPATPYYTRPYSI